MTSSGNNSSYGLESSCSTAFLFIEDLISNTMERRSLTWVPPFELYRNRTELISVFTEDIGIAVLYARKRWKLQFRDIFYDILVLLKRTKDNFEGPLLRVLKTVTDDFLDEIPTLRSFFSYCGVFSEFCVYLLINGFESLLPTAIVAAGIVLNDRFSWHSLTDFEIYKSGAKEVPSEFQRKERKRCSNRLIRSIFNRKRK